jgi:hypothetical protein
MPTYTTALFADRHSVHAAVEQLVQAGFPRDAISIVLTESTYEREFGGPPSDVSGVRPVRPSGVLGAILTGLVALPSLGGFSLRAAGPLVGPLLSAQEGASPLSDQEAHFLSEGMSTGLILIGVQAEGDDRLRLASQLLELSGGAGLQAA